ncbi:ferredoxin [Patescibacteria group bacterium]
MKIKIDKEKCIGCGTCPALCPEVFELNDSDFKAFVKEGADISLPCVKEAKDACPVEAIEIE